jgi:hypothetical protein
MFSGLPPKRRASKIVEFFAISLTTNHQKEECAFTINR